MTQQICPSSWCEIHLDRFSSNLELALDLVPEGRRLCVVLKADAYGHGIQQIVPLVQAQDVACIGITSNPEARAVRDAGFDGTLIRLRAATPEEMENALQDRVEEQVGSLFAAEKLWAIRNAGHSPIRAHLALNAKGMSRDGLEIATTSGQKTCLRILKLLGDNIVGICTHFPCNGPENLRQSSALFQRQAAWVLKNSDLKRSNVLIHAGSSLTLIADEAAETDMYRCGAILYGILKPELGFQTTMDLKARVVSIGDYPKGNTVGYDRDFPLVADRRLACISIGYANGISRVSQNRGAVSIKEHIAPVLGKISMNTIVADVTGFEDVEVGDEVNVFGGTSPTPIAPTMAERQFKTIMAELYTDWGGRNHRVYRQ